MKIVLLTTDNREHERDYTAPLPYFGTAPTALLQGFAKISEAEVHVVCCVKQPVASPEKIAPNIFYHSLVVPSWGWMRSLYHGCSHAVRKKIRELRPDIVHGQGTERDCAISAVRSGFPNVLTIHGNMRAIAEFYGARFGSFHWLAEKLETSALQKAAGVFCNSAYTEKMVRSRAQKIWRVPNAVRLEFFGPRQSRDHAGVPVLLNIGSVLPYKQTLQILDVAGRLHERGLKFQIQFGGEIPAHTDYGAKFAQKLAEAEKAGYAKHLGFLNATRLVAVMDAADALVHFPTEEAFGLVVAEALARNLKLFGAATGGVVDIAAGADGAELFAADDFSGLEKALAGWINAGARRPENASELMASRYHPEAVARRHLEIYREVLAQPRR